MKASHPKRNTPGYVYFIREDQTGHVKIGWTDREPQTRLERCQTGNPRKLRLTTALLECQTSAVEGALHRRYAPGHLTALSRGKLSPTLVDLLRKEGVRAVWRNGQREALVKPPFPPRRELRLVDAKAA